VSRSCRTAVAAALALACLAAPALGADEDALAPTGAAGLGTQARAPHEPGAHWGVTTVVSQGALSGGRADWREALTEILHRPTRATYGGARLESRERNEQTDVLYTALISHVPVRTLELHGAATFASDPLFSAEQNYLAGLEWRAARRWSALLDVSRLEFAAGAIDQYKPGAVYWFTERKFLTYRYAYGRAFGQADFDAHSLRLDWGGTGPLRVALAAARGTDPEKDPALPGVLLTDADLFSAYGHWRFAPGFELIAGAEYEDRHGIYTRVTGVAGLALRF
jgi:YaiO family outer membrane protein